MVSELPRDTDSYDPATKIRTHTTYRQVEDKVIQRVTKYARKVTKEKVLKPVAERRNLAKFGAVKGVKKGLEPMITFSDTQDIILDLSGKKYEGNEADDMLSKIQNIKGGAGFLYRKSAEVRKEAEKKQEEEAPKLGGEPGRYVAPNARPGASERPRHEDSPTIRVSNLSESATSDDIRQLFSVFGRILRVHLAKDRYTDRSRGYAFVTFSMLEEAQKSIETLDGYGYDNLILRVEMSKSMAEHQKEREKKAAHRLRKTGQ